MSDTTRPPEDRPLRSDARRNRGRLVAAAAELILELGGEPSRDAVAQRAGVGIATLYRNFPDRQDLLRAVAVDALDRAIAAAETALADAHGDGSALGRYLHAAIDVGLGVVNIIHPLLDAAEWPERTAAASDVLDRLIRDARRAGAISGDVTATDVAWASIRFARPLAAGIAPETERAIAHRQLDHYLNGLRIATSDGRPGP